MKAEDDFVGCQSFIDVVLDNGHNKVCVSFEAGWRGLVFTVKDALIPGIYHFIVAAVSAGITVYTFKLLPV